MTSINRQYNFKKSLTNHNISESEKQLIEFDKLAVQDSKKSYKALRIKYDERYQRKYNKLKSKYQHSEDIFDAKVAKLSTKISAKLSAKQHIELQTQDMHIANTKDIIRLANIRAREAAKQIFDKNEHARKYAANKKHSKSALAKYIDIIPIIHNELNGDHDEEAILNIQEEFLQLLEPLKSSCQHCTSQTKPLGSCVALDDVWDYLGNKGNLHYLHDSNTLATEAYAKCRPLILQVYDKYCIDLHIQFGNAKMNDNYYFCCMCKNITSI